MPTRRPRPVTNKRIDTLDALIDDATAALIEAVRMLHPAMLRLNDIRWKLDAVRRAAPPRRRKGR